MINFSDADNSGLKIFIWFLTTPLETWGIRHISQVTKKAKGRFDLFCIFKKPSPE